MTLKRNTTTRDRHRAVIRRTKPPCAICGEPIDYALRSPHPMSFEVDHIVPFGPNPTPQRIAQLDVLTNKQATHRHCNREKWHKPKAREPFVTTRAW